MSGIKRILMTADTIGGVWTYALELTRAFQPHGIEVALATMGRPLSSDQERAARALHNLTIFESSFRLEWMEDARKDVSAAGDWLLRTRDRVQPDLIHLNNYAHGMLAWGLPTIVVGHSCVFSWWKAVHGELPPPSWNWYREEVTKGLRAASVVVSPSKAMMFGLAEIYGAFKGTCIIPNGRDPHSFLGRAKFPFVLCAGRLWDEGKNVSALADVAGRVKWPVYVAGQSEFGQSRHSSYNRVRYLGELVPEDLADWMSHAAIFAFPARYEPFGLTILEAGLSGCALVLGDIPSLRENWDGAALFVPPDDRTALHAMVDRLIQNPRDLQTWAVRARNRAQTFTAERMARNYSELYKLVCELLFSITH